MNRTLGLLGKILDIYGLVTNMSSEKSTAFVFLKALCKIVCRVSVHKLMWRYVKDVVITFITAEEW